MTARRSPVENRCPKCRIQKKLCFCSDLREIENQTFVTILMHCRERHLNTNTATLAKLVLKNCRILMRGTLNDPLDLSSVFQDERPKGTMLYLFPEEGAEILNEEFLQGREGPIHLIVPDGSWRQARKFKKREPFLRGIPTVKILPGPPTRYYLRHHHKEESLCTFEAIARALGNIENQEIQKKMEIMLDIMVNRVLKARSSNRCT